VAHNALKKLRAADKKMHVAARNRRQTTDSQIRKYQQVYTSDRIMAQAATKMSRVAGKMSRIALEHKTYANGL
jgi:hypothetical protein